MMLLNLLCCMPADTCNMVINNISNSYNKIPVSKAHEASLTDFLLNW